MKKQFLTFALSIAILLGGAIPAYALDNNMVGTHTITRASQYLDGYSVGIEARGNGKIAVAMTVDGTGIMEKIGVAEVEINGVCQYQLILLASLNPTSSRKADGSFARTVPRV